MHPNVIHFIEDFNSYFIQFEGNKFKISLDTFYHCVYFKFIHGCSDNTIVVPIEFYSLTYDNIRIKDFVFRKPAKFLLDTILDICFIDIELDVKYLPLIDFLPYLYPDLEYSNLDMKINLYK